MTIAKGATITTMMRVLSESVKVVGRRFRYVRDRDQYAFFEVWTWPDDWQGDCEDFSLLVLRENTLDRTNSAAFWALMKKEARIWKASTAQGGHAVLEVDGWFVENIYQKISKQPVSWPGIRLIRPYSRVELLIKLAVGWLFK